MFFFFLEIHPPQILKSMNICLMLFLHSVVIYNLCSLDIAVLHMYIKRNAVLELNFYRVPLEAIAKAILSTFK